MNTSDTISGSRTPAWTVVQVGTSWRWTASARMSHANGWAKTQREAKGKAMDAYAFLVGQEGNAEAYRAA